MSDTKFILFICLAVVGLGYCLWKTQLDWQKHGFGLKVVWGLAASLSAFLAVAFLLTGKLLSDLP